MAPVKPGAGQLALITGASGGIGLELAECFAAGGYDLVLVARTEAALREHGEHLAQKHGVKAAPLAMDLGQHGAGQKLAGELASRGLAVDVLVNNAGFGASGAFATSDAAAQLGMIDLNVRVLVELTHALWPGMLERKRGGVLNVASTAAFQPGPLMAVYYASKAFVLSFSEALWQEARGSGVHVSCLCPGPTESGFHARAGTSETKLTRLGAQMSSAEVARLGYRGFLRNRRVVVTGARNRLLAALAPFMPRRMLLRTVQAIQSPA